MLHDTSALVKSMDSILASPFTHDQKGELGTHQLKLMECLLQLTALTVVKAACNLARSLFWCESQELHKNLSSYRGWKLGWAGMLNRVILLHS